MIPYLIGIMAYCGLVSVLCAAVIIVLVLLAKDRPVETPIHPILDCPREPHMVVAENGVAYLEAP